MRIRVVHRTAALMFLGSLFSAASAAAQTVTIFSVPGAQQTRAFGINPAGDIVGIYLPNATVVRGFRLGADGITPIDYPNVFHGFVMRKGELSVLDVPGANLTQPVDINSEGQIVGVYRDTSSVFHMFLWSQGVFTPIDYPGAVSTGASNIGVGINPSGTIVGQYRDALNVTHGFVLDANGYRTVDIEGYPMTVLTGINAAGTIVGRARGADGFDAAFVIAK